jgi:hypothetical protein
MRECDAGVTDEALIAWWAGDDEGLDAHLFECAACTERLELLRAMSAGVSTLAREGRISGLVSRALLNRLQRDGVRVRWYSLSPGDIVPCAIFPDDDLVVSALRADLSSLHRASVSVVGTHASAPHVEEFDVSPADTEVLWALPAAEGRALPSTRIQLTLSAVEPEPRVIAEYVLEHTALGAGGASRT